MNETLISLICGIWAAFWELAFNSVLTVLWASLNFFFFFVVT